MSDDFGYDDAGVYGGGPGRGMPTVVVRYTEKGTEKTADDLGKLGKDGMKAIKGTITKADKGTKTVVVKSADGTEKTFEYTANASKDIGEATGKGVEKGTKVTVYYTEAAGKKIAHFFAA